DIIKMKSSAFQFYKFSPMSILTTFWSGLNIKNYYVELEKFWLSLEYEI
ncbi:MAG: hypothetical protein ACJA01_002501, partial [Saprospiraceae bacterium]